MDYRYLRIAWSAFWGFACILIIAVWEHAMREATTFDLMGIKMTSLSRRLLVGVQPIGNPPEYLFAVRYAVLMWIALVAATVPWIPRRFSLRTLLIISTLAAAVLGLLMSTFI